MMKIHRMDRGAFLELALRKERELMARIDALEVIVVERMYDPAELRALRDITFAWGQANESSWHPCLDGVPDYHRLHDNYPQAHVKSKMHAFYRHGFHAQNAAVMARFGEVFDVKNHLAGAAPGSFMANRPSEGPIARVNVHHYPRGGGYQAEHIDPVSPFARIQTLIMASQIGVDYQSGGLYARPDAGAAACYIDEHTKMGDMVVLSPGVRHGVAPIDPDEEYGWRDNDGRWMILPIVIHSDYPRPEHVKPREVA